MFPLEIKHYWLIRLSFVCLLMKLQRSQATETNNERSTTEKNGYKIDVVPVSEL